MAHSRLNVKAGSGPTPDPALWTGPPLGRPRPRRRSARCGKESQATRISADVISQIGAIKRLLAHEALTTDDIAARYTGAKAEIIRRHLDILQVMGEVQQNPDGRYQGAA